MNLPELPIKIDKRTNQVYRLQGLDRSDEALEGTLWDTDNISSRRLPYFTTCRKLEQETTHTHVSSISAWEELLVIDNGKLYYGDTEVGNITDGDKQYAIVNTKIVIYPDKVYLDLNPALSSPQIVDMVNEVGAAGTIVADPTPSTEQSESEELLQTLTISGGWSTYHTQFEKFDRGDYVTVTVTKNTTTRTYDLFLNEKVTKSSTDLVITFRKDTEHTIPEDTYSAMTMKRVIPDLDYICSADNRLWGCNSGNQAIYASELGVPTQFNNFSDTAAGSWATNVSSPSDFTGCAALGSSILFFKEFVMHKILGSSPSDYSLYDYDVDGVKKGCARSLQVISDELFYLSPRGVMLFTGGNFNKISRGLGDWELTNGVAGSDGERYYLSCTDKVKGETRDSLFTYDIKTGLWLREDDTKVECFARYGGKVYMVKKYGDEHRIMVDKGNPTEDEWYIQFNDMYESIYNNYGNRTGSVLNKKRYSRLYLRVEMPKTSYAIVKVRTDGGRWTDVGHIAGRNGVFLHAVPINRCDKFGIRIEGKGEFTLLAMAREYIGESARNE